MFFYGCPIYQETPIIFQIRGIIVELTINEDALINTSVKKRPRQGWSEAFAKMSADKADKLLLPDNIDNETFEWVW
jgi:hypothetical protein